MFKLIRYLSIILFSQSTILVFAQQQLFIRDKVTSNPLQNAEIKVTWNEPKSQKKNIQIGQTNENGAFVFQEEYIKNDATLTIQKPGYQSETFTSYQLIFKNYIVYISPSNININEVVISASKFEEPKKDVPRQIELITKKEIAFANQQNTADLLQNSGQVFVQRSQMGGGSPVMRGFEANKILIVIDGVRMNNAIYRGGHLQNILRIDQNMLEKTELFFGPGSVIYGSDALGGVMHFTTLQPTLSGIRKTETKQHFFSRYGSVNNETTVHYDINLGLKKWAFLTSFNASSFGDMLQGENRSSKMEKIGLRDSIQKHVNGTDIAIANENNALQTPSAYKQVDVLQKILFAQSNKIKHTLNLQFSNTNNIPRYDRLTEKKNGIFSSAEWYYGPELRTLASYQLKLSTKNILYNEAQITAAYQYIEESRHNRNFNNPYKNSRLEFVHVVTVNTDFSKQLHKHEIRYGAEFTYNNVNSHAFSKHINTGAIKAISTRYPDGGSKMKTAAVYVSHAWEISDNLILSDGLRLSAVQLDAIFTDKTFFSFLPNTIQQQNTAINGQIGLVYVPAPSYKLTAALSSGFRAPNIDDLAKVFESTATQIIVPNPELKPEYAYTAEAGLSKLFYKKIHAEVIGYYNWITDLVTTKNHQINGNDSILYNGTNARLTQTQNAQNAFIYGTSATLSADVSKTISIVNTFNYTFGRIKTDSVDYPLDHIPPIFGRSAINMYLKGFRSEFFVLYNGWKRLNNYKLLGEDNEQYATSKGMPPWYTLNIRTSYNLPVKQIGLIQFQIGIENILDVNYRTFASGFSGPGRNVYATIRLTF